MTAMKKILAFTLCLAMLLSMNAAAFATEGTEPAMPFTVGEQGFDTLKQAYDALPNEGGTITMNKDAQGPGLVVSKPITIDFNGFCYSLIADENGKGVGSPGTETNGLQILQESGAVTLKGGKLEVDEEHSKAFYILVQNYADLTVENMVLDGKNLDRRSAVKDKEDSYVLSNNAGDILLKGDTSIFANNEGKNAFAFDVCDHKSYDGAPSLSIDITGTINGNFEVTGEGKAKLSIQKGMFTADVSRYLAPGHSLIKNENNNVVTFVTEASVAKVGEIEYKSLEEAFKNANGGTVTLIADHSFGGPVNVGSDAVLDLNGKTINGYGEKAFLLGAKLTVVDSIGDGLISSSGSMFEIAGGSLSIKGGSFVGFDPTAYLPWNLGATDTEGVFTVKDASAEKAVAFIGSTPYPTLGDAIAAAQNGDTIVLNKDYEAGAPIDLREKKLILDINSKILKATVSGDVLLKGGHLFGLNKGDGAMFEVNSEKGAGFTLLENKAQALKSGEAKLIVDYAPGAFYTGKDTVLSIAEGKTLSLSGTSVFEGSVSGAVKLSEATATLKSAENSGVVSGVDGMNLVYAEGTYKLVNANAKARIGNDYYDTFGAAYDASAGSDKTIVLLQDITVNQALDLESRTLDLGGRKVTLADGGTISGKVIANGAIGDVIAVSGSADYISEGANVTLALNNITSLNSGKLTVNCNSPLFSVAEGAELVVAEGKKLSVAANATVAKLGGKGIIELAAGVSLTAPEGLNVSCADTNMMAVYHGGVYKQVNKSSTVRVGENYYAHLGEALNSIPADSSGVEIVLLSDQSIGAALDLKDNTLKAEGKHIYLAQGGSLKGPEDLDVSSGVEGMNVHYGADGVYRLVSAASAARIGDNFYDTLELAAAAEGDIVLLKDATLSAALELGSDKLDLNSKKVTGTVSGTVIINGGAVGTSVVSSGSGDFISDGATVKLKASVPEELVSGKLTVNKDLTVSSFPVASGAELIVASGKTLTVSGAATFAGKLTINGKVLLASKTASITAASGLTIGSALEDCKVSYASGAYKLIDKIYLAQVGEKKFETMEEALAELTANPKATLKLLMGSNEDIEVSKDATVSFDGKSFTGKLSVKDGAKLTISEADLLALGVNGVSADKASVIVGKNEVKLTGKVTIDANGNVTATPSSGAVGINSVEVTVPTNGAVVADKNANVSLPKGSKVAMSVKSGSDTENIVIDIIDSGALAADGSVTATMVEVDGVSYGKLPVKRGSVDMLYFAPYEKGETSFVFKLDGTVLAKSEGEKFEYLTDGNDSDLYPDLKFEAKKTYFQTGTKKSLTATCNGFFDDLYSLKLVKQGNTKGEKIALNKDIVIKEGSTEVEIKNVCLSKLSTGKYDLILTYKAGDGKYQDVKFAFEVGTTPATGDSGFGGFAAAMAVSAMGAFAVLVLLKKKGNRA